LVSQSGVTGVVVPVSVWLLFCEVLDVVLVLDELRPMGFPS
jgi:hypothetical protein